MNPQQFATVLAGADLVHGRETLAGAIERIGGEIDRALNGAPAVFLTVMQGGVIFAGQLATEISAPLEFDYVHVTRFHGGLAGGRLQWIRAPALELAGATVLLVDDILDEGNTLKEIRDECLRRGAARVMVAVLCEKRHNRRVDGIHADFVGVEVPDRYVFGYGLDYRECGRNLPGIYAVDA